MLFTMANQSLHYHNRLILQNLTLSINAGEKVAIIGASGAGKSTLLKSLREQHSKDLAWCPQQPGLVPMLSCHHNIYMGQLENHHFLANLRQLVLPSKPVKAAIYNVAQELEIEQQLKQASAALSGGQAQRCSIARAIYSQKDILLADEPLSALDFIQAQKVLRSLCQHFPTLVISLHNVELAINQCQRIIALKDGRILFDKPSSQVSPSDLTLVYN